MNRNTHTLLLFTLFIQIFYLSQASHQFFRSSHQGTKSSSSGTVLIRNDTRGYYIDVDFAYENSNNGKYTYPMLLGLYTSQTFLASNCLSFSSYDCKAFNCSKKASLIGANYPDLSAYGYLANSSVHIDYDHWNLNTEAVVTDYCTSKAEKYGVNLYGIVGLGLGGKAAQNFNGSALFSVYLQKNLSSGLLMFRKDMNFAASSVPIVEFPVSSNWEATLQAYIHIASYNVPAYLKMIFDVNADAIGLPEKQYHQVLEVLRAYGIQCKNYSTYKPSCEYGDYLYKLPNMTLINGTVSINIPPEIYVQNGTNKGYAKSVVLNLRGLSATYRGKSYVNPLYGNYMILDSNFMSYYYTVFDGTSSSETKKISLYQSADPKITVNEKLIST